MTTALECELAESRIRPLDAQPLLSIVVPSFNRPMEMATAIGSIANQVSGGLEAEVEVIISDNASQAETQDVIRALYDTFPCVKYYLNAQNLGAEFQFVAAPFRARGKWVWLFGDDDFLIEGGLERIVDVLRRQSPAFLTLNRCVGNDDLSEIISARKHAAPSRMFDTIIDLTAAIGMDQLSFFTSQIYLTSTARTIDADWHLKGESGYISIPYYLDGFRKMPSMYESGVYVLHRWQPDDVEKHNHNFYHLAVRLPQSLARLRDHIDLPKDLLERLSGARNVMDFEAPQISFFDSVLDYTFKTVGVGRHISAEDWAFLRREADLCRPGRREAIEEAYEAFHRLASLRSALLLAQPHDAEFGPLGPANALARLAVAQKQTEADRYASEYYVIAERCIERSDHYGALQGTEPDACGLEPIP